MSGSFTEFVDGFHFLRPLWLLALIPLALLVGRATLRRELGSAWARACDPALLRALVHGGGRNRRTAWLLASLAGTVLVVALAGPSWKRIPQPMWQAPVARVLVIDLSQSMQAADFKPSRLARARFAAVDLLSRFDEGLSGLVVFAGSAFPVVPLTTDNDTVAHLLESLSPDLMPVPGGVIAGGIEQAVSLLKSANHPQGHIIVFTDSEPDAKARNAAREAVGAGYRVHVVAVGTDAGAPIPKPDGGWITDRRGEIVLASVPHADLRELARAGGGRYLRLAATGLPADAFAVSASDLGQAERADDALNADQWRDEAPLLALLIAPLVALGFRRGWLGVVLVTAGGLMPGSPAHALEWADLWLRPDQQAYRALQDGAAEQAAELFEDPDWRAAAQYRAGRYEDAAAGFSAADVDGLYNRGNALARQGQLQAALEAYEEALKSAPDDDDILHNRDLVAKLLEQQQQQQQQQGDPQEDQQSEGESSEPEQGGSEQQSRPQQGGEPEGDPQQNQQAQQNPDDPATEAQQSAQQQAEQDARDTEQDPVDQASTPQQAEMDEDPSSREAEAATGDEQNEQDERQMALEQWLRRIPDDPGGLLRRKFQLEQQRRGTTEQQEQSW